MKKIILATSLVMAFSHGFSQVSPAISSWLQNTVIKGRHYVSGNPTPINDPTLTANTQSVQYSATQVYVTTMGIPSYITGPFLDGNPSLASNQNAIFKFPLAPVQNTGTLTPTSGGNIGVFVNGVAMFDYRDGVSWKNSTNALAGGPLGGSGDGIWNRDAIVAEKGGFDCSKGHPAMGNYHHHQNPSAFKLDLTVISTICTLYDADGLYVIDASVHSPLIGYAYDGFPVYGAYGYKNVDGTGGIVRMKTSWSLRAISTRTALYTGSVTASPGPSVSVTYPLGTFKEDYGYTAPIASDYLDDHNGRFCVTPEYPAGIYCYFATVDANWNSAYPYLIGPTYYGTKVAAKVVSIGEAVTTYTAPMTGIAQNEIKNLAVTVYPNPASDLVAVQVSDFIRNNYEVSLSDVTGKLINKTNLYQGSTIVYFDTKTVYAGIYFVTLTATNGEKITKRISIIK